MSAQSNDNKAFVFESMGVPRALATMAIPAVASQIVALVYNIADIWFIGRTNNPYMMGASSLVLVLYMLLVALASLFGTGGGTLVARQLGKGDTEAARKTASYSIMMGALVGLGFSLLCLATMNPLLRALGANDNTIEFARQHTLFATVLGGVPIVLCCTIPTVMRNVGYSKEASIGVALCGLVNIALDPLLMFVILPDGYQMLAAGLALMLSNVIAVGYFVITIRRLSSTTILVIPRKIEKLDASSLKSLYSVGMPAAIVIVLFNSLGVVLNRLAVSHGDAALAAVGIVLKLERLPQNIGMGICLGMVPLVAYNYAKKDFKRMNRFFSVARIVLLTMGLGCTALFFLFAEPIVHAFIDDAETVRIGAEFLRCRSFALPLMLLAFQLVYYMQAVDQGKYAFLLAIIRHLALSIPAMIVFDALYGIEGLIWSQTVAEVVNIVINYLIYLRICKNTIA